MNEPAGSMIHNWQAEVAGHHQGGGSDDKTQALTPPDSSATGAGAAAVAVASRCATAAVFTYTAATAAVATHTHKHTAPVLPRRHC